MNKKPPKSWLERAQEDQLSIEFLAQAGVNPALLAGVRMDDAEGFELPCLGQEHLFQQAMLNLARQKCYRPPAVDPACDIIFGELFAL